MGKVIDFSNWYKEKEKRKNEKNTTGYVIGMDDMYFEDTTEFLKKIQKLKDIVLSRVVSIDKFRKRIEVKISTTLVEKKIISPEHFYCSMYIARLLAEIVFEKPETWYAFDYHEKVQATGNCFNYKKGGDMCFLIVTLFPEKGNRRLMSVKYYRDMGTIFYTQFYYTEKREIGYHMSRYFDTMAEVTAHCVNELE